MKTPHTNVLVRMSPDLKENLEVHAKNNQRSLTKEINERLAISLAASGPTLQSRLAQQEAARTAPGIAPSAFTPTITGPSGQPVHLSDHDMQMLRVFHAIGVEKQLALLTLLKQP